MLAPQGCVNYFNVVDDLAQMDGTHDIITTNAWQQKQSTPLKEVTVPFHGNRHVIMHVRRIRTPSK